MKTEKLVKDNKYNESFEAENNFYLEKKLSVSKQLSEGAK